MPISVHAGVVSRNDFHQTGCGGTKLLLRFALKIGPFSFVNAGFFILTCEFPQVWTQFALKQCMTGVFRAILISKRTRPTPVGNCRILRKM
jgi:hypothetical protein